MNEEWGFGMKMRALLLAAGVAVSLAGPAEAGRAERGAALGAGIGALGGAVVSNGDLGATVGGAAIGGLLGYGLSGGDKKTVEHHHHVHRPTGHHWHKHPNHHGKKNRHRHRGRDD